MKQNLDLESHTLKRAFPTLKSACEKIEVAVTKSEIREWIALYFVQGEWRLITREVATLKHATKMKERYDRNFSYKTRLVYVGDKGA